MAGQLDRLRFQLRTLPPAPSIPDIGSVSAHVVALAGITTAVSTQIKDCLSNSLSQDATKALEAYSHTLAPLGEALTELGRMHAEIAHFNFTTHPVHRDNPSHLERPRQLVSETVSGCCEAADDILDVAATELREAATKLMPSPSRVRPAATSLGASVRRQAPLTPLRSNRSGLGAHVVPAPGGLAGPEGRRR